MRGYGFPWPSIISKDSEGKFIKLAGRRNQYHVSFLSDNSHCWIYPTSLTLFQLPGSSLNIEVPKRWEFDFNRAKNILRGVQPNPVSPAGPTPGGSLVHARESRCSRSPISETDIDNLLRESRARSESSRRASSSESSDDENVPPSQPVPSPFLFLSPSKYSPPPPPPAHEPTHPFLQTRLNSHPIKLTHNPGIQQQP